MTIPWSTALYVFRKVLPVVIPVVIEKAPDLLKTLDRRRRAIGSSDSGLADDPLVLLHQRIDAVEHASASQTELLTALEARLRAVRRALALVWVILGTTILVVVTIAGTLLFRS
jgi:hypothetical protein